MFSEVQGMTELNDGKPRKVKNARPYSFCLEEDSTNFGPYLRGGIATQVKQPKLLKFKPLSDALRDPGDFLLSDFSKVDHPQLLHVAFQALDKFRNDFGRFPATGSDDDARQLIALAASINESMGEARLEEINEKILRHFASGARATLNPMAAIFGGIVGQEVVKACSGKFHPLFQVKYFSSCLGFELSYCPDLFSTFHLLDNLSNKRSKNFPSFFTSILSNLFPPRPWKPVICCQQTAAMMHRSLYLDPNCRDSWKKQKCSLWAPVPLGASF